MASRQRKVIYSVLSDLTWSTVSSVQEKCEPGGMHPRKSKKNDPRKGTASIREQVERAGAAGEEKAPGRPEIAFQHVKGIKERRQQDTPESIVIG